MFLERISEKGSRNLANWPDPGTIFWVEIGCVFGYDICMTKSQPVIDYGFHSTLFGRALIALEARHIVWISFHSSSEAKAGLIKMLRREFKGSGLNENSAKTRKPAKQLWKRKKIPVLMKGTPFQNRVWKALLRIPFGQTCSYEQVARRIGKPRAVRAVASAVARNRIAFLIPCHRVIRKDGALHQYRWGAHRKKALLDWESN